MQVTELVTDSYYLSGVVSSELESVSSFQLSNGLTMLNDILAEKSATSTEIPYYDVNYNFNTVAQQEMYFVPNLVEVETITYEVNEVRYGITMLSRREYFGTSRANNVSTLPTTCHFERTRGGANIYFYYYPDSDYKVNVTGKFDLQQLSIGDNVSDSLEDFYISYLKYELAYRISDFYNFEYSARKIQKLAELRSKIFKVAPPDMKIAKSSIFNEDADGVIDYAYANLGSGFVPPGF